MEKRLVHLGRTTLGAGRPALCVPVMGKTLAALGDAARAAAQAGAEVIELRADAMHEMPDAALARRMCAAVREGAPGVPLLFTLRTSRDGGAGSADGAAYEALLAGLLAQGACPADAVDVELSAGGAAFARIAGMAHAAGIAVVGSSHDFSLTPPEEEICARLGDMQRLGADVCKIAVTPNSRMDVLTLMRACVRSDEALYAPVIAIAMGPMGVLTRIGGEAFGSCLTFGAALAASAPGQLGAAQLGAVLDVVHGALGR